MKKAPCVCPITSMPDARRRKRGICFIGFPQHQTITVSIAVIISHSVYIFWDSTNKEEFYHLFSSPTRVGILMCPLKTPFHTIPMPRSTSLPPLPTVSLVVVAPSLPPQLKSDQFILWTHCLASSPPVL